MDSKLNDALLEFVHTADALLNNNIIAAFCFGSAVYDDFHEGYSDLDFFIIVNGLLSEEDFRQFHLLRDKYKQSKNPYLSVLEGEIISKSALVNDNNEPVIYWGTSKDRLKQKYGLAGFSLKGLLDKGYLIYGTDIRNLIPYPSDDIMMGQVLTMIETIRSHAVNTSENIHSADWLFLITQSLYWLKTSDTTGKTPSAKWVLDNYSFNWSGDIEKAINLRKQPALAKEEQNKEWLRSLAPVIQSACDYLETCYQKKLQQKGNT